MNDLAPLALSYVGKVTAGLGTSALQHSHLSVPTPWLDSLRDRLRLFVSSRDTSGVSRVFVIDVDPDDPTRVLSRSADPVLDIGRPGSFDGDGIICTAVRDEGNGLLRMLYVGFERNVHGTYRLLTGSSSSHDSGDSFVRDSELPLLERQAGETSVRGAAVFAPHSSAGDSDLSQIVYAGGTDWTTTSDGQVRPVYSLRQIEVDFAQRSVTSQSEILLNPQAGEHGFGRPCFIGASGRVALISVRLVATSSYRLEVARLSPNGKWARSPQTISFDWQGRASNGSGLMFAGSVSTPAETWVFLNSAGYGRDGILVSRLARSVSDG